MRLTLAGAALAHARILLRRGALTPRAFCVLDCLIMRCGGYGRNAVCVSQRRLGELLCMHKEAVSEALKLLARLRLIRTEKRRRLVPWGRSLASRQQTNVYHFLAPPTESRAPRVFQQQEVKKQTPAPALDPNSPVERALRLFGMPMPDA